MDDNNGEFVHLFGWMGKFY